MRIIVVHAILFWGLFAWAASSSSHHASEASRDEPETSEDLCTIMSEPFSQVHSEHIKVMRSTWTIAAMVACPVALLRVDFFKLFCTPVAVQGGLEILRELLSVIQGNPLAESTLILKVDAIIHFYALRNKIKSSVALIDMLDSLMTLRADVLLSISPLVSKPAIEFTMPIIDQLVNPGSTRNYDWIATSSDYERLEFFAKFSRGSFALLEYAISLRSMLGVANSHHVTPALHTIVFDRVLSSPENVTSLALAYCAAEHVVSDVDDSREDDEYAPPMYLLSARFPQSLHEAGTMLANMIMSDGTFSREAAMCIAKNGAIPLHARHGMVLEVGRRLQWKTSLRIFYQTRHNTSVSPEALVPIAQEVCSALSLEASQRDLILMCFVEEFVNVLLYSRSANDLEDLMFDIDEKPSAFMSLLDAIKSLLKEAGGNALADWFDVLRTLAAAELSVQPLWPTYLHVIGGMVERADAYTQLLKTLSRRIFESLPALDDLDAIHSVYHGGMADYMHFFRPLLAGLPWDLSQADCLVYQDNSFNVVEEALRDALPGVDLDDMPHFASLRGLWPSQTAKQRSLSLTMALRALAIAVSVEMRTQRTRRRVRSLLHALDEAIISARSVQLVLDAPSLASLPNDKSHLSLAHVINVMPLLEQQVQDLVSTCLPRLVLYPGFRMRFRITPSTLMTRKDPVRQSKASFYKANVISAVVATVNAWNAVLGRQVFMDLSLLEIVMVAEASGRHEHLNSFYFRTFSDACAKEMMPSSKWLATLSLLKSFLIGKKSVFADLYGSSAVIANGYCRLASSHPMQQLTGLSSDLDDHKYIILQTEFELSNRRPGGHMLASELYHLFTLMLSNKATYKDAQALKPFLPPLSRVYQQLFTTPQGHHVLLDLASRMPYLEHSLLLRDAGPDTLMYRLQFLRFLYRNVLSMDSLQDLEKTLPKQNAAYVLQIILGAVDGRDFAQATRHTIEACKECSEFDKVCVAPIRASSKLTPTPACATLVSEAVPQCLLAQHVQLLLGSFCLGVVSLEASGAISVAQTLQTVATKTSFTYRLNVSTLSASLLGEEQFRRCLALPTPQARQALARCMLYRLLLVEIGRVEKQWEFEKFADGSHIEDWTLFLSLRLFVNPSSSMGEVVAPWLMSLAKANGNKPYERFQAHYLQLLTDAMGMADQPLGDYEGLVARMAKLHDGVFRTWLPKFLVSLPAGNALKAGIKLVKFLSESIAADRSLHSAKHPGQKMELCMCQHDLALMLELAKRLSDEDAATAARNILNALQLDAAFSLRELQALLIHSPDAIASPVRLWLDQRTEG